MTTKTLQRDNGSHIRQVIPDGETGDAVYVHAGATATLIPATTAKLQFTTSHKDEIVLDTATWIDAEAGEVSVPTSMRCDRVTAIRGVSTGGELILEIVQ